MFFIPLYPKFPLLDIKQTWVNIRFEDVLVAFLFIIFTIQTVRKKTNLKSPLSVPIVLYWIIGAIVSLHTILFFTSVLPNLKWHLVLLFYIRRIEYMILFFAALTSIKNNKDVRKYAVVFCVTLLLVTLYGFLQKYAK